MPEKPQWACHHQYSIWRYGSGSVYPARSEGGGPIEWKATVKGRSLGQFRDLARAKAAVEEAMGGKPQSEVTR